MQTVEGALKKLTTAWFILKYYYLFDRVQIYYIISVIIVYFIESPRICMNILFSQLNFKS